MTDKPDAALRERIPEPSVYFELDKDGLTGGLQLSIGDESSGYRIAGPKYSGNSRNLLKYRLAKSDAEQIRTYLDFAFPPAVRVSDLEAQRDALADALEALYRAAVPDPIFPAGELFVAAQAARAALRKAGRL